MIKLDSYTILIDKLPYGKDKAVTAEQLYVEFGKPGALSGFKRKLRQFANEGRLKGHWIIGDDNGYYKAVDQNEWNKYKFRRFTAIRDELTALARCDRISLSDLIKNVYAVTPKDNNFSLF